MDTVISPNRIEMEMMIRKHVSGLTQGYFVTIDTLFRRPDFPFNKVFFEDFANQVNLVTYPLNIYTYGRTFRRCKKLSQHGIPTASSCKLTEVTAYEIGEDGRFHLHSMLLHDGSCNRTAKQVKGRISKICSNVQYMTLDGPKATHVVDYDDSQKDRWIKYYLKSFDYFKNTYGFVNISLR